MWNPMHLMATAVILYRTDSVRHGFVYCPAYPCTCESRHQGLIVNCRNLYLSGLPKILSFNGRIKELSLRQNNIRHLPMRGFQGLLIENLDLFENSVTSIHDDAFVGLEDSLESLRLQLYAISGLPTAALKRLRSLRRLVIKGCKVPQLKSEMFDGLSQLIEFRLTGCRISNLAPQAFEQMTNLLVLGLAQNSLQYQHLKEINTLENLSILDLSNNDLQRLNDFALSSLTKLKQLNLSFNSMEHIAEKAFHNLEFCLEQLDLHANELESSDLKALRNLKTLRILDLCCNNISVVCNSYYFQGLSHLANLNLGRNILNVITKGCLGGLELSLRKLELQGNPLGLIEIGTFLGFGVLEYINLRKTYVGSSLNAHTFDGVWNTLQVIDLSEANIMSDDLVVLTNFTKLTSIDLSYNRITYVPFSTFQQWESIQNVNFSHNAITDFLSGTTGEIIDSNLTSLDMSWNKLSVLWDCAFFAFKKLRYVSLHENPLNCSCPLSWLYRWVQIIHPGHEQHTIMWRCQTPEKLHNRAFAKLEFEDFRCEDVTEYEHNCVSLYKPSPGNTGSLHNVEQPQKNIFSFTCRISMNVSRSNAGVVYVSWSTDNLKYVIRFALNLTRLHDSSEVSLVTVSSDVSEHIFNNSPKGKLQLCVTAVSAKRYTVGQSCEIVGTKPTSKTLSKQRRLRRLVDDSFVPLLLIYVAGSLALAFMIACIVVCILKRGKLMSRGYQRARRGGYKSSPSPEPMRSSSMRLFHSKAYDDIPSMHDSSGLSPELRTHSSSPRTCFSRHSTGAYGSAFNTSAASELTNLSPSQRRSTLPSVAELSHSCVLNSPNPLYQITDIFGKGDGEDDFFFYL